MLKFFSSMFTNQKKAREISYGVLLFNAFTKTFFNKVYLNLGMLKSMFGKLINPLKVKVANMFISMSKFFGNVIVWLKGLIGSIGQKLEKIIQLIGQLGTFIDGEGGLENMGLRI